MRVIIPRHPTPDNMTSNVAESTVALWAEGTTYGAGDEVRLWSDGAFRLFEALIENTGKDPNRSPVDEDGAPYWLPKGPTNRWAMFGGSVSEPTIRDDGEPIVVTYTTASRERANSLALFGLMASKVTVVGTSVMGGGEVYRRERGGLATKGPGWWRYLFAKNRDVQRMQFFNMPAYPDLIITLTVEPRGDHVMVGEAVLGSNYYIGEDEIGMQPRIKDYSINQFDDNFGYNVLIKRQTRRRLNLSVAIPSARADDVFATMEELASTRVVWVADKFEAGSIYGFYTDFTPTHSTHPLVYASLKIEGLI